MTRTYRLSVTSVVGLISLLVLVADYQSSKSDAAIASNLQVYTWPGTKRERFMTYDFTSETAAERSESSDPAERQSAVNNVDMPVNLIFTNRAKINTVKHEFKPKFIYNSKLTNARMWGHINDAHGWRTDVDRGMKTQPCPETTAGAHYRIYADPDDYLKSYRLYLGWWVPGTSHLDVSECPLPRPQSWYSGRSEEAEHFIAVYAKAILGSDHVREDLYWLDNLESGGLVGCPDCHHWYQNNGEATKIIMPGKSPVLSGDP
jgi:hypothetical protein